MRATEFMHYININRKDLKLGQNLDDDLYTHLTIRMKIKRARYEHQSILKKHEKQKKQSAKEIRDYFRKEKDE